MVQEDYIKQLANYFKKNLTKGYTAESLKVSLLNQGYSRISVENAFNLANQQLAEAAPVMKEKPQIVYKIYDDKGVVKEEKKKKGFFKRFFNFAF
ncbi:hypothetical protein GF386_01815 [Candidatus Pacearchaeota archaeon]|nr:hypothetical protein [Candidatus Pacearchaeota archaeon]MBD3282916.1 hypothetical protein [Candidatus Pacearchaeota archaeon]